ncbi:Ankyrin repeat-containing domain protein [Cordyceps fumosorosea ARSEF 2679]|uniref:Ankyrin repeat-containing domain protein n=1 Tax=Cordyceps fumosorosea (strain ARSEF 2679) TaxID=1081104 RepID=A0A167J2C2_CORFA|nr:Ankyrin repeat-containing domain protein [Cordyceps fumosorosea ARSEF 2679]OAA49716.1 Ankyrin repeat-containing domain protein [Cordyceps fumosorosea ARSEF 2679]
MSVAHLSRLPDDVLLLLADELGADAADASALSTLSRTSRRLHDVLGRPLYARNARRANSTALQWASHRGVAGTVRRALAAGADPNARRPPRSLHRKRRYPGDDDDDDSQRLHALYVASPATRDLPCHTPLTLAARGGHLDVARLLLAAGARVDVSPRENASSAPLLAAVEGDHLAMVRLLTDTGRVDFDGLVAHGLNPLAQAVQSAGVEMVSHVLARVANGDLRAPMMPSPLILAVRERRPEVVRMLLAAAGRNVTPRLEDDHGRTALSWAAAAEPPGNGIATGMFQLLLDSGEFDPDAPDRQGRTPLALAAGAGNEAMVAMLLVRSDVDPNRPDRDGLAPVFHALRHEHTARLLMGCSRVNVPADALFRLGCEKRVSTGLLKHFIRAYPEHHDTADGLGATWLHVATAASLVGVVNLLLKQKGVRVDRQRTDGATPLLCAVQAECRGGRGVTSALLQAGADVNLTTARGWSALCYACRDGNVALVEQLLERGSDTTTVTDTGETLLYLACEGGQSRIVRALLAREADPVLDAGGTGRTALHLACSTGKGGIVDLLLLRVPRGHPSLSAGRTPLHDACEAGFAGIAERLLEHGADPEAALEDGTTPLHLACRKGSCDLATLLLNTGKVDVNRRDAVGRTPLSEAADGPAQLRVRLREWGAVE